MYALVHLGKGKYYGSTVFGFYRDDMKNRYSGYYVVFNPEKTVFGNGLRFNRIQNTLSLKSILNNRYSVQRFLLS